MHICTQTDRQTISINLSCRPCFHFSELIYLEIFGEQVKFNVSSMFCLLICQVSKVGDIQLKIIGHGAGNPKSQKITDEQKILDLYSWCRCCHSPCLAFLFKLSNSCQLFSADYFSNVKPLDTIVFFIF